MPLFPIGVPGADCGCPRLFSQIMGVLEILKSWVSRLFRPVGVPVAAAEAEPVLSEGHLEKSL